MLYLKKLTDQASEKQGLLQTTNDDRQLPLYRQEQQAKSPLEKIQIATVRLQGK
ncbi:hypothetical protein D3C80_994130 [compost metagenome]